MIFISEGLVFPQHVYREDTRHDYYFYDKWKTERESIS